MDGYRAFVKGEEIGEGFPLTDFRGTEGVEFVKISRSPECDGRAKVITREPCSGYDRGMMECLYRWCRCVESDGKVERENYAGEFPALDIRKQ